MGREAERGGERRKNKMSTQDDKTGRPHSHMLTSNPVTAPATLEGHLCLPGIYWVHKDTSLSVFFLHICRKEEAVPVFPFLDCGEFSFQTGSPRFLKD